MRMADTEQQSQSNDETNVHVLSLLHTQATLYEKLEDCSARQRSLIGLDDSRPLLDLLAERKAITDALAKVADLLGPVRRRWEMIRDTFTPEQKREAEDLLGSVKGCLKRLMERDEVDARMLAAKKQLTARALGATHSSTQAISAYRDSSGHPERLHTLQEES
jgi:hypothetical protein